VGVDLFIEFITFNTGIMLDLVLIVLILSFLDADFLSEMGSLI